MLESLRAGIYLLFEIFLLNLEGCAKPEARSLILDTTRPIKVLSGRQNHNMFCFFPLLASSANFWLGIDTAPAKALSGERPDETRPVITIQNITAPEGRGNIFGQMEERKDRILFPFAESN